MAHSGSNSSLGAILKDLPQPEQLDTNVLKSELTKINFKLGYNPEKFQGLNSTRVGPGYLSSRNSLGQNNSNGQISS